MEERPRPARRRGWRRIVAAVVGALSAQHGTAADVTAGAPPARCDKPAYLVVIATITDPEKSRRYVEALRASGLYPQWGGGYITSGKSPEVLEGQMFGRTPIVVARFPCMEAARRFWYSETYQKEILPLREGAGTFEVAIFEERLDDMRPRPAG